MRAVLVLDLSLIAIVGFYLLLAPYTKVEESFNMQAIHDMLNYGVFPSSVLQNYDHISFPGVVPRSFIGSAAIASVVKAIDFIYTKVAGSSLLEDTELGQLNVQIIARAVLGAANIFGLVAMRRSVDKIVFAERKSKVKGAIGFAFTLLLLSQFHLNFYSTRTLPNFVALPLVTYGLSKIIRGDMSGLTWLAFTGTVFRLEIGVFAACIAIVSSFGFGQSNIVANLFLLVAGSLVGLVVTTSIDSYFWGHLVVPEFESFRFNIVHGQSVHWGVEPYSAYFSKYIVNFFRPPHVLVLAAVGLLNDPAHDGTPMTFTKDNKIVISHPARHSLRILFFASIIFVAIMSFQPHKEWRFIVYIIPVFTLVAANGLTNLFWRRSRLIGHKFLLLLFFGSFVLSFVFSAFMSYISSFNYPGGDAIGFLNTYLDENPPKHHVVVHMDVPSCMTGVTKFTELHNPLIEFDKTENEEDLSRKWNNFTYLITLVDMSKPQASDYVVYDPNHWEHLALVPAYGGVNAVTFLLTAYNIYNDPNLRYNFILAVWNDLKQGQFNTLESLLRRAIVLRDFMFVYKRTAQDSMPAIILLKDETNIEVEEFVADTEEPFLGSIEPDTIKEELNDQIDDLEVIVEQEIVEKSFPTLEQ
ncbi:CIC11C00000005786 [Sungouiella intermedia]|uniref:Mannosyltransferase n=1 Tax=Sungouiella intermedia TaxID=45354 RepID=A0A1L0C2Q1_9ASCO|nr:CIC11C00000005786 [[Candida] intermedia]